MSPTARHPIFNLQPREEGEEARVWPMQREFVTDTQRIVDLSCPFKTIKIRSYSTKKKRKVLTGDRQREILVVTTTKFQRVATATERRRRDEDDQMREESEGRLVYLDQPRRLVIAQHPET